MSVHEQDRGVGDGGGEAQGEPVNNKTFDK